MVFPFLICILVDFSFEVSILMCASMEKSTNMQIKNGKTIHLKDCVEGIFYTKLNNPTMITNLTNVSLNAYTYLSTLKQKSIYLLILKLKEHRKFESYSNIFTCSERQNLRLTYEKE